MEVKLKKDGTPAKKRGRPKKVQLPEEVQEIVEQVNKENKKSPEYNFKESYDSQAIIEHKGD